MAEIKLGADLNFNGSVAKDFAISTEEPTPRVGAVCVDTATQTLKVCADGKDYTVMAKKEDTDKAAYGITSEMSTTDYVLKLSLTDQSGVEIANTQVDLPLEEMVVNVEYDEEKNVFIITLKDGTTREIPVSGMLKGLVTETGTQTLTNKTLDGTANTLLENTLSIFKSDVVRTKGSGSAESASDDAILTERAIYNLVSEQSGGAKTYTFTNPELTAADSSSTTVTWDITTSDTKDMGYPDELLYPETAETMSVWYKHYDSQAMMDTKELAVVSVARFSEGGLPKIRITLNGATVTTQTLPTISADTYELVIVK